MAGVATALELFPEAVRSVFERWTALNLAVSHNWGDGDSLSKREELITNCCGGFMNGKKIDPTEVEDFLDGYMLANYTTEADDESPKEVPCQPAPLRPLACSMALLRGACAGVRGCSAGSGSRWEASVGWGH